MQFLQINTYPSSPLNISHLIYLGNVKYQWVVEGVQIGTSDEKVSVYGNVEFHIQGSDKKEEDLYNFAYKLGPRGLDEMIKALIEETMRAIGRTCNYGGGEK